LKAVLGSDYREADWINGASICMKSLLAIIVAQERRILLLGRSTHHSVEIRERDRIANLVADALRFCARLDMPWDVEGWPETHLAIRMLAVQLLGLTQLPLKRVGRTSEEAPAIALIWACDARRFLVCTSSSLHT
jgi:hypothetical protein